MSIARPIPWLALLTLITAAADAPHGDAVTYLGVTTSGITPALSTQLGLQSGVGVVVDAVEPDGPAQKAGLAVHDVVTHFGDQVVVNVPQFTVLVRLRHADDVVKLTVVRRGKPIDVSARLGERAVPAADVVRPVLIAAPPRGHVSSIIQHTDGEHSITLTTHGDGDRHARVVNRAGEVIFDGPLNTPEDAARLPADCLAKIEAIQRNFERFQKMRSTSTTTMPTKPP